MTKIDEFGVGTQIRLKNDPGRLGVLTGNNRDRAGTMMYQVGFPEGKSYQPEYELEIVKDDNSDVYALLEEGRYGRVTDLRRNLSHIQLSGRLANLVYSMDTTNTEFYAYQFKPVLTFLESPSNGILIADEVGLGKTIESGLIWTELRARYDARRLLVVCPAMLREKWRDELRERFGVEAEIVDAKELLTELKRDKHSITDGKALVCSMQGIRPPKRWWEDDGTSNARKQLAQFLSDVGESDPVIDLMIVDEAHYMRNPESQTAKVGQLLRGVSEHVVLLSATPVNLKEDDLFHLLNLVDPDSFDVKEVFPQVLTANEPLQAARDMSLNTDIKICEIKEQLKLASEHHMLQGSRQLAELLEDNITDDLLNERMERIRLANRIEKINLLKHAVNRTRKIEVTEWKTVREPLTEFVELNDHERTFYDAVTQSIREYALHADISEGFLLASPQRQVSSCMYAAAKAWKDRVLPVTETAYEDFGIEYNPGESLSPLIEQLTENVLPSLDLQDLRRNDSKFNRLYKVLSEYLNKNQGEKVILFSYFRGTLSYLSERLSERGIKNQVLVGGMQKSKQDVINEFRESNSIQILLSSEVASEGVDLQFSRVLINYDLPWNPMKVEQRIGRIDRIGQEAKKISIWNICYADTIDQRILVRLFDRLRIFERALGGMEAILGEEIKSLTDELLSKELTKEQEEQRIESTAMAIERIRQDQDDLENQASHLIAHGGYILEQVQAAHDFKKRITELDLIAYMKDYLDKYCQGHQFLQTSTDELIFNIRLPSKVAVDLGEYIHTKKLHGQTLMATGDEVHCQFINKMNKPRQRIETINQFHPMIRFISEDLKRKDEAFFPLIAVKVPERIISNLSKGVYAFAVSLWTFTGLRVEEELRSRVISLENNEMYNTDLSWELVNSARVEGEDWLSVVNDVDLESVIKALDRSAVQLEEDFRKISHEKKNENYDRVDFQVGSAERHKERKIRSHRNTIEEMRSRGKIKTIPAWEGKIKKEKDRFDMQVERLKSKGELSGSQFEVCFGVIRII